MQLPSSCALKLCLEKGRTDFRSWTTWHSYIKWEGYHTHFEELHSGCKDNKPREVISSVQKLYGSAEFVNVIAVQELVDLLTQDVQRWLYGSHKIGRADEIVKCSQVVILSICHSRSSVVGNPISFMIVWPCSSILPKLFNCSVVLTLLQSRLLHHRKIAIHHCKNELVVLITE